MIIEFIRISKVAYQYRIDQLLEEFMGEKIFFRFFPFLPQNLLIKRVSVNIPRGERVRLFLIQMGTYYVKLGQGLSVRKDLLPTDICDELALLRDACPSFSSEKAIDIVKQQLGKPTQQVFKNFDSQPLASASIAQVHSATLQDGQSVIVKIVRPDIDKRIFQSLKSMFSIAKFFNRFAQFRRYSPLEIVKEFATVLNHEKDMIREAASANQIRANFKNDNRIYIPKIYWDYTTDKILVMEKISGIPVHQVERLKKAKIDLKTVAENGVLLFFTQLLEHNLFHADMHPGNVFINENGVYVSVDYGIVGALSDEDRLYIAENLLAFFERDYRRVALLHIQSGWVDPNTRVSDLESAVRSVSEPLYDKPIGEISFGQYVLQLLKVSREFGMTVQPQLLLLQKTLFNIEGLGRELYPQLNLWETAKPVIKKWIKSQYSPKKIIQEIKQQIPYLQQKLPSIVKQIEQQNSRHSKQNFSLELYQSIRKLVLSGIFLLAGVMSFYHPFSYLFSSSEIPYFSLFLITVGIYLFFTSRINKIKNKYL